MSTWSPEEVQIQVNWDHYVEVMEIVILVYDWFLTLDKEVEYFWQRDCKKLPAILFFINRYASIFGLIAAQVLYFWPNLVHHEPQSTGLYVGVYIQILMFIIQINVIALFFLRVVALYGGSRRIKVFLSVASLCVFVNSVVQLYLADWRTDPVQIQSPSVLEQIGNETVFSKSQGFYLTYLWIGLSAFDLCVFSLTLRKTLGFSKADTPGGIMTVIMRDGK
ncbi:hypothetical protein GYMLUDRAFT_245518 [Collybiopsis luxurians FD-317 M1]|uniref:DUF6533 domain-containing protein n=1 Tax=Collybiopsis luxurians FD-317 M1 TaxID=944289 RepID=A0A0D0BUE6_9AGAR|nr:hypothetical protein GYMLUDRAFT_245518 [Collybiopsis luxurians FD-317 M1]